MPEDFTVKKSKNEIDETKSTETKKSSKEKKIISFCIVFLTLLVIPAVVIPIVYFQKKNVGNNIAVTVNNVTVNKVENKGLAKKMIIKDGKEFFVMTKKQV